MARHGQVGFRQGAGLGLLEKARLASRRGVKGRTRWENAAGLYFGRFPDDTKGDIITEFIDKWTKDFKQDIEETYPSGLIGERGGARFKTQEKM